MWEVYSRAERPYADIDVKLLKHYLDMGKRLERPKDTPDVM